MRCHLSNFFIVFPISLTIFLFVQLQKQTLMQSGEQDLSGFIETESFKNMVIEEECKCKSSNGNVYNFCYHLPENPNKRGIRFNCSFADEWERLELLNKNEINEKEDKIPEPVFVTAFSEEFVENGKRLITKIRQLGSHQKIIIYDLGITVKSLSELKNGCNIEVRKFIFSKYHPSVKNLREYRWKPIVITETLAEFGAIWYLDSSVIFEKLNLTHVYDLVNCQKRVKNRLPLLSSKLRDIRETREKHEDSWDLNIWHRNLEECRKSSYLLHGYSGHGILSVTNPEVYNYFPTNENEMKKEKAKMYDAGFVYAINSKHIRQNILKWYVLCALEENCMGPKGSGLTCQFKGGDRFKNYAKCHRYDQSIINILLANAFYYDRRYYVSEIVDFFQIKRSTSNFESNLTCI